ncbi:MAG: hypothetical protein BIFFINMI_00044 [Phycisphaerae bacterium]|nr:hypothetical protein [Phycisphaerae bacterium]
MSSRDGIVEFPCDVERLANGNTLITDAGDEAGDGSEVVEVDPSGRIVWRYGQGLRFAHSAKRLGNGNTLIADTTNDRVIEVSADGQVVFSTDDWGGGTGRLSDGSHLHYPNKARLLDDGTLLITDRNNDRAVQAARDGRVVWQYAGRVKHPHNAQFTAAGHLLIADSDGHRAVEVSRDGRELWAYGDGSTNVLNWPRDADRLPSGNTLIVDSKHARVVEVTPDGRVAWEYVADHWANFYDADRLPNGNTLMASQQHQAVLEVDPAGRVVWQFRNYTRRYPINDKLLNCKFEEVDSAGAPLHWVLARRLSEGGGELTWTQNAAGKRCPGLAFDRSGAFCLQQTRRVEPGKTYRVSGLVKAEALKSGFACVQIAFLDADNGQLCDATTSPRSDLFSGDTPWSRVLFKADAPPGAVAADVRLFINGQGRAFVDELFCFG